MLATAVDSATGCTRFMNRRDAQISTSFSSAQG
jgi:hypothetical protein